MVSLKSHCKGEKKEIYMITSVLEEKISLLAQKQDAPCTKE